MREDSRRDRRRAIRRQETNMKNLVYIIGTIIALGVIAFFVTIMIYNSNLDKMYDDLETERLAQITKEKMEEENKRQELELGIESDEEIETTQNNDTEVFLENEEEVNSNQSTAGEIQEEEPREAEETNNETQETSAEVEPKAEDPTFSYPVEGELIKEYAKDNLVYSETLKEWVTHTGIDIKADKTTVVRSAEKGKVTAIKNDPRYGTTVIIEHTNGYETRYANLLTAEFVTVGEEVDKGQTIGTVGDTGAFEVLDAPHLHFEILKDGEYQDPTIYIN